VQSSPKLVRDGDFEKTTSRAGADMRSDEGGEGLRGHVEHVERRLFVRSTQSSSGVDGVVDEGGFVAESRGQRRASAAAVSA